MSKEQVMDYVMNSPANTNPNVLSGMLDGISGTQLPSPTESDNGKVLGVDGGEYKLVEQSDGSSPEYFELGSFNVSVTDSVGDWKCYQAGGTFPLENSIPKTLAQIVGNKKVIGIVAYGLTRADGDPESCVGADFYASNDGNHIPLEIFPYDKYGTLRSGNVYALCKRNDITQIKVYAICI